VSDAGVPSTDEAWRDLVRAGMAPAWRLMAEGSGGSVWQQGSVAAAIVPRAPERSVFNSVFYDDSGEMIEAIERLADVYDEAGIQAWTVWVPEADAEVSAALSDAGHVLDAEPRYMAMELAGLSEPDPDPELEIAEREDYAAMAALNEVAYGYPRGDFDAISEATGSGLRIYFGSLGGEEVATCATWRHGGDAELMWVAVAPEGRGRGVSGRLCARALADARDDGAVTTTLQSTKLGYPVYESLGYRDLGAAQMWERRRPAD
jgi:GNAT superfamily N-acetyltransferase